MTSSSSPSSTVSGADLRHAIGHFATGVAVVTSRDADDRPVGTTASAISSLSLDPPLILVCFDRASLTLAAVRHHGAFGVNVLAAHHEELSTAFARRGAADAWDGLAHEPGATGTPRLPDVLAHLECAVEHRLPGGDHEIVVGRVLDIETGPDDHRPLLFYRGAYASIETP